MYIADNNKPKHVISILEVLAIVLFFSLILGLLHSNDTFRRLLLSEKSNYDLTEAYLRNMVRLEPDNATLLYEFAKVLVKQGKYELAERTLAALEASDNRTLRKKAVVLRYKILKHYYYMVKNHEAKKKIHAKLEKLLEKIIDQTDRQASLKKWLEESWWIGSAALRVKVLKKMAEQNPSDLKIMLTLYNTSKQVGDENSAKWAARMILSQKATWLGEYEADPETYVKKSKWIATMYLDEKKYREAAKVYMDLFQKTENMDFLFLAIDNLLWGKHYEEAFSLAKQYEDSALGNEKYTKKILDVFLQTGHIEEAKKYSLKILKRVDR